jgi:hypothetical protein
MSEFDTQYDSLDSLPDLELKMTRYSKILYDLSLPDQVHRHTHTYEHYKKQLIALVYEYTKIKGKNKLTEKLDTMLEKIEKLRDIELKRGEYNG